MVSVPILVNYTFGKYFFANGGPLLDFQKDAVSFDSQSGIGYSVGIGAKYSIADFAIYINPNFKQHAFIPFEKENNHQRVTELGVQVGVGYQF